MGRRHSHSFGQLLCAFPSGAPCANPATKAKVYRPMTIVHFLVESFDPKRGGMEESAFRIVQAFAGDPNFRFIGYLISAEDENPVCPKNLSRRIDLDQQIRPLIQPLGIGTGKLSLGRRSRLQILVAKEILQCEMQQHPDARHVLLSFFLSTAGFVGQQLACELNIPHIACARGSDLGHRLFTQEGIGPIEFVTARAARVVTTSRLHAELVRKICGRGTGLRTIYNALPPGITPCWQPRKRKRVHLVSAGGYCIKKGTHLLLEAVARLLDEGLPIELEVVGPTRPGYWDRVRELYSSRHPSRIRMNDMIGRGEMESFLLNGDIYCSASLSEGCSNATMLALGLGMPVVSTATGALVDLAAGLHHVRMVPPASVTALASALRNAVLGLLNGSLQVDRDLVCGIVKRLSPEREYSEWSRIFDEVARKPVLVNLSASRPLFRIKTPAKSRKDQPYQKRQAPQGR